MEVSHVMNCNKIKTLKVKQEDLVDSLATSTEVELSADGKKIRRKGGKAVPTLQPKDG